MHGSNPTTETVPDAGIVSVRFLDKPFWRNLVSRLRGTFREYAGPLILSVVTLFATCLTLDPGGDRPGLPAGPGLTTDEVLNVEAGLSLQSDLAVNGWGLLLPDSWSHAFSTSYYQSDYPPLGRLWLAGAHDVAQRIWPVPTRPSDPPRWFAVQARMGSAVAFALTVWLVGFYATRWFGRQAGWVAAAALPLMPRLFAHAHIASIESILGLVMTGTVLWTADRWPLAMAALNVRCGPVGWKIPWTPVLVTGLLLGLTLLTKIQGVLFPVPFTLWALWRFGRRGGGGVAVVGVVSAAVLLVGWPWLWEDTLERVKAYLAPSDRGHLFCWYMGRKLIDSADPAFPDFAEVPWHYPLVIFLITVPVGLHILGFIGARARLSDARLQLVLGVMIFPLILFAIPGITVYDGERLFAVSFPLWAICMGSGAERCLAGLVARHVSLVRARLAVAALVLAESSSLLTLHPCQLSYYSWLVGGPRGAVALGMEPTYWGDSITRELQQQIVLQTPAGSTVHVAPVLHPIQLDGMLSQAPWLLRHGVQMAAYDDSVREQVRYILVFRRNADGRISLNESPNGAPPPGLIRRAEVRRAGVQLAAFYEVTDAP